MKHPNIKRQLGQGMVEYIIIVALIALAAIAAFSYFGNTIRGQTAVMSKQVAGQNATQARNLTNQAATAAQREANADYNLGDYEDAGDVSR